MGWLSLQLSNFLIIGCKWGKPQNKQYYFCLVSILKWGYQKWHSELKITSVSSVSVIYLIQGVGATESSVVPGLHIHSAEIQTQPQEQQTDAQTSSAAVPLDFSTGQKL